MTDARIQAVLTTLETYLLGKRQALEHALACLLAEGHLLIEDVPGVGKTTLAKSLAHCIHAEFKRVQFTSDLLPSDLIGVTVFQQARAQFEFKPGPVFTNVLLADEINRANPKTQSALLEAMHDAHISHDGVTEALPKPFFVIATQNSQDHHGTFPLPESQLDRFLMRLHLGYPKANFEKRVIAGDYERGYNDQPRMALADLLALQARCRAQHVAPPLLDYIQKLVAATRQHPNIRIGVSPRGGQALYRACQALSMVRGRDFVTPEDVLELLPLVCAHRLMMRNNLANTEGSPAHMALQQILAQVNPPT